MNLFCNLSDLKNESDVEQKFLYQFLNRPSPEGCGFKPSEILSKHRIMPYTIGKANKKSYIPDYIILLNGTPVLVIEAKSPDVDLEEAYNEARLYAHELNSQWKHRENPCKRIIVSNGKTTLAGYYDENKPIIEASFDDLSVGNINYSHLVEFSSRETLRIYWENLIKEKRRDSKYFKPVGRIGYSKALDAEIKSNAFGQALSFEYGGILIPDTEEEYKAIVQNAYVHSKRKEHQVEPILKVIRKARLPAIDEAEKISSDNLEPFISGVERIVGNNKANSLILLIGSVGSGKSTFIRYLQNVSVPQKTDLEKHIYWCIINMNNAPISQDIIYHWVVEKIISTMKDYFPEFDFGNRMFLDILYKDQIKEFTRGIGSYLKKGSDEYYSQLFFEIRKCIENKELTLESLIRYIKEKHNKTCIFVFDNVDQGNFDKQLLMFQVSEWFRNKFLSLVMLTLRDTTFNEYRTIPPLDTIAKDLVFRIDPPDLLAVLQERLTYICRMEKKALNFDGYIIENGMKIVLKENDYLEYFKCILHSIRQDNLIKNVFYSITGRDVRFGIELFIDFCKSGHLLASDFFAIRATDGDFVIPHYRMMDSILRGTRLYYSNQNSKIKNVFTSEFSDEWVDPFIRIDILQWLDRNKDIVGDTGTKGFFRVETCYNEMLLLGHTEKPFFRELSSLIKDRLIISGNLENVEDLSNIIRISPYGTLHIYLLTNITYLSACSEDIYYKNLDVAQRISDRITGKKGDGYLSKSTIILNVEDMVSYLLDYREQYLSKPEYIFNNINNSIFDLTPCIDILNKMKIQWKTELSLAEKKEKFPEGTILECMITGIQSYGIFVSMELIEDGYISQKNLVPYSIDDFEISDIIKAKILEYKDIHHRFELVLVEKIT